MQSKGPTSIAGMWRGALGAVVGGSAPSEMEFWKQADAAQALHKDLVRKYRLGQVQGESNCNQCFFLLSLSVGGSD